VFLAAQCPPEFSACRLSGSRKPLKDLQRPAVGLYLRHFAIPKSSYSNSRILGLGSENMCGAKEIECSDHKKYGSEFGFANIKGHMLLIGMMTLVFLLVQAQAGASDPLDPGQLGESMSMPLSPELILAAERAGVTTGSNPISKPDRQQPSFSAGPVTETDAVNSIDNVNVTGTWSIELGGTPQEQMILNLVQNDEMVMGQGAITRGNETKTATVSGSVSGDKLSLIVMPVGVLDLYRLNLSLSSLSTGIFTAYMADGSSRSGEVTFSVSSNIFRQPPADAKEESSAYATGNAAGSSTPSTPVQLSAPQGLKGRISTKESTSMMSGGGSMSSSSSSASSF